MHKVNPKMLAIVSLFAGFDPLSISQMAGPLKNINDELKGVDIDKEYELIKQKKSKLTSRLRYVVEARYENRKLKEEKGG